MEKLNKHCFREDVIMNDAAFSACERGGQRQRALRTLEEISNTGIPANVITYRATISAGGKRSAGGGSAP